MIRKVAMVVLMTVTTNSFTSSTDTTFEENPVEKEVEVKETISFDNVSKEFSNKVVEIADSLGTKAEFLMSVFHVETGGTFRPGITNKYTGATGLIQFLNSTAKEYGTTTNELSKMSDIEQLDYVFKYFKRIKKWRGELKTLEDVYMAVHYPAAVGRSRHLVLYEKGTNAYKFNKSNDLNKNGKVTKSEISYIVKGIYNKFYKIDVSSKLKSS